MNKAYDGAVTYIHKAKDGKDIYFIANSTNEPVETNVILRGKKNLALWDPHTGEREDLITDVSETAGQSITTVPLYLEALKSVFYIEQ